MALGLQRGASGAIFLKRSAKEQKRLHAPLQIAFDLFGERVDSPPKYLGKSRNGLLGPGRIGKKIGLNELIERQADFLHEVADGFLAA